MSVSIRCVHCKSVLRLHKPLGTGETTRCPRCERVFTVGEEAAATAVRSAAPTPAAKHRFDDDDEPLPERIKKKKRRPSRAGLIVLIALLGGGGLLAAVACAGCGVGGYFLFFGGPRIAGQWDLIDPQVDVGVSIQFRRNGTGMIDGPAADVHFDYTLSDGDPMQLEWRITRVDTKGPRIGFGLARFNRPPLGILMHNQNLVGTVERFRVTIENNTLTTTPKNGGATLKWRRRF
jgi:hypothetical protein